MFSTLREVLCAGGVLAAQAGGEGSLREVRTILTELGVEWESLNNYANAVETCAALEAAGFVDVECWMVDEPIEYAGSSELRAFLLEGVIAPYVSGWPEAERTQLATDVANRLAAPVLHFVRLNIRAVSGPA
jgi:trans-aconitate 2-methyltransferase